MEQIFRYWPKLAVMAREIGESPTTVRHWKRRGMIPARHDQSIIDAACKRGITLSLADIAEVRAAAFRATRQDGPSSVEAAE